MLLIGCVRDGGMSGWCSEQSAVLHLRIVSRIIKDANDGPKHSDEMLFASFYVHSSLLRGVICQDSISLDLPQAQTRFCASSPNPHDISDYPFHYCKASPVYDGAHQEAHTHTCPCSHYKSDTKCRTQYPLPPPTNPIRLRPQEERQAHHQAQQPHEPSA